jgi:RNA polymerase sigma-70 factor (ECF subfamily)
LGAHHLTHPDGQASGAPAYEKVSESQEPLSLAVWSEFHRRVQDLPEEQREIVGLLFYQELTQAEAADILHVTVRTVQRRWHAALLELHDILKAQWPGV